MSATTYFDAVSGVLDRIKSTQAEALRAAGALTTQVIAVAVAIAWAAVFSIVAALITKLVTGLRVSPEVETDGLDIGEHGERAYN